MLNILRQIIEEVASAEHFGAALRLLVQRIAQALETQACSIFILDQATEEYVLAATQGLNPNAVHKLRVPLNQGLVGLIGDREEPLNIDDATAHPRFLPVADAGEDLYRAYLGAPIIYHRQVLGVLIVQQTEPRRYDEEEEAFLVTLAVQLAGIIAHARATGALAAYLVADSTTSELNRSNERIYSGIAGAPGIGIGEGVVVYSVYDIEAIPDQVPEDIAAEIESLEAAFATVREDLRLLSERLYPSLPAEERALFDVYQRILDREDLGREVVEKIRAGNWAPGALRECILGHVRLLEHIDNEYMRDRAVDIKDLGLRVLAALQPQERVMPKYAPDTILVGDTLTATALAEVPEGSLRGMVSLSGSSNSHLAILARAMKIPTVMGVADIPLHAMQTMPIIVDGFNGKVYIEPIAALRSEFASMVQKEAELDATFNQAHELEPVTRDGYRIGLMVNTGLGADIGPSLAIGTDGVGLYRTEVPFLMRERFPSSEEQRIIYRQLLASFAPRRVNIRTLDIGGDKPLPYFPIQEDNPFLGWRGIRITLDHPEIFLVQVRAMLRASEGLSNLNIMLPMITDISEVDEAVRLINKAYDEVCEEGLQLIKPLIGAMIEVPSAVYQVRLIAKRVDFLSVGSNDLTQYILAVDRNNFRVASLYNALHPAVLTALMHTVTGGHQEGKIVSICGELAADPLAAVLLLGLGFDTLSMNASSIGRIRWVIRQFSKLQAEQLAAEVLTLESPGQIRNHLETAFENLGLGSVVRIGRSV